MSKEELLKYLDIIWHRFFDRNPDDISKAEQACEQIRKLIQQQSEQDEIHCNFIDIILDLYEQLEERKK